MINVAICDDEIKILQNIYKLINIEYKYYKTIYPDLEIKIIFFLGIGYITHLVRDGVLDILILFYNNIGITWNSKTVLYYIVSVIWSFNTRSYFLSFDSLT